MSPVWKSLSRSSSLKPMNCVIYLRIHLYCCWWQKQHFTHVPSCFIVSFGKQRTHPYCKERWASLPFLNSPDMAHFHCFFFHCALLKPHCAPLTFLVNFAVSSNVNDVFIVISDCEDSCVICIGETAYSTSHCTQRKSYYAAWLCRWPINHVHTLIKVTSLSFLAFCWWEKLVC